MPFSRAPLFVQLADELQRKIVSGEWKAGQAIKNELDLAREFDVSVGTMRKALETLENAKLITRTQGRGSFVAVASQDELKRRYENVYFMDRSAPGSRIRDCQIKLVRGDATMNRRLELRDNESVFQCAISICVGTRVTAVVDAIVPYDLFPDLHGSASYDLYDKAREAGIWLGDADERLFHEAPPLHIANAFGVHANCNLIRIERTIFDLSRKPVEYRTTWTDLAGSYYQRQDPIGVRG